jgi:hypothetical protein
MVNIALMHGSSASTPHVASVLAAASVATDTGNDAGLAAAHAVSAAALAAGSNSSDSDDSDIKTVPVY